MFRKLNLISAVLASLTLLFACATSTVVKAQGKTKGKVVKEGDLGAKTTTEGSTNSAGAKGWDGKVQGKVLVTPVTVNFDSPADYDNFAAGRLRLNLILKNTLSGQTIRLDSKQLTEGFRPGDDKSKLTIHVIVDNMSAPLSEAACGQIAPSAENTAEGVNITLSYSGCGAAQRPGAPIGNIIVKGGKNPGGNLNIAVGDPRITPREEAVTMSQTMGVIPVVSNKGAGSPKANGF